MIEPGHVVEEIRQLTSKCIELSLCNDQNYPAAVKVGALTNISFAGGGGYTIALKNVAYAEVYSSLLVSKAYNLRMVDGALLQLSYTFHDRLLTRHRLAFFPSPDLTEFQNSPEIYEAEEIYAEIIEKSVVPFPIRFDYEDDESVYVDLHHPRSHLTLGQYSNCRIPVTAPLSPYAFLDFVLRSFYNTAHRRFCERLPKSAMSFEETISSRERGVVHFHVPTLSERRSS
jgi:hypothetical protein